MTIDELFALREQVQDVLSAKLKPKRPSLSNSSLDSQRCLRRRSLAFESQW
jgi:hypothetical protein